MNTIYSLTMRVIKEDLLFRIEKHFIKSVTSKNYVIEGKRIKIKELDQIQETITYNTPGRIAFQIWTTQENKIKEYKNLLIERINQEIEMLFNKIQELSKVLEGKPRIRFEDYTKDVEISDVNEF